MDRSNQSDPTTAYAEADPLEELVFEALERIEEEGPAGLEALCAAHPASAVALRARVDALARAGLVGGAAPDRDLPRTIGEFEIERNLGEGGMGVVYLARQPALDRRVALKLIRPEHLYFPGARERFQREVTAVARLSHPGVVTIHTVGEADGIPYFAMEALEGASLAEILRELHGKPPQGLDGAQLFEALSVCLVRRGFDAPALFSDSLFSGSWPQIATRLALAIVRALEHAHARGVLHRDVKPANVILTAQGRVVLLDFGLAAMAGASRLTKTGSALGSLPYMSPEAIARGKDVDEASDVWSAGVTYYELLTLRLPFDGSSDLEVRSAIDAAHPSSPRLLHAGLSWDPETVCLTALERDRTRRYPTAAAFALDLVAILELRPIAARRPGLGRQARAYLRRHPSQALGALFALLLIVGGPLVYAQVQRGARLRIEDANRRTELANADLALALAEAESQRDRAEHNFDQALAAVDTMLTKVGAERLSNVPRMDEVRRELLESALAFQTELLEQRAGDPALRRETARAHGRVGSVLEQLGRIGESVDSQRAAVAIVEEVARETGEDTVRLDLVEALTRLGGAELRAADGARSRAAYERARDLLLDVPDDDSRATDARGRLASVQYNLGVLHRRMGSLEPAREALVAALALEQQSPEADSVAARRSRALSHMELGNVLLVSGDAPAALVELDAVHDLLRDMSSDSGDPGLMHIFARAHFDRGRLQAHLGDLESAKADLDAALPLFERLAADFPGQVIYRITLAGCHGELADLAGKMGSSEACEAGLRGAVEAFAGIAAAAPGVADYRGNLGISHERLAMFFARQGRFAEAIEGFTTAQRCHAEGLERTPNHAALPKLAARARQGELYARTGAYLEGAADAEPLMLARELATSADSDDLLGAAVAFVRCADGDDPELGAEARNALERAFDAGLAVLDVGADDLAALRAHPLCLAVLEARGALR